MANSVFCWIQW